MLKNLSYKKKNLLLGMLSVLLLLIVYSFGISNTLKARSELSLAKNKLKLAESAPQMAKQLKQELLLMDEKLGNQNNSEADAPENLLGLITHYCQQNNAVLREFPRTSVTEKDDMIIETNHFVVGGTFQTLLKLVYKLEQKNKLGKVSSVKYQLVKDFKTRKMLLTASLFIQNIKKK